MFCCYGEMTLIRGLYTSPGAGASSYSGTCSWGGGGARSCGDHITVTAAAGVTVTAALPANLCAWRPAAGRGIGGYRQVQVTKPD